MKIIFAITILGIELVSLILILILFSSPFFVKESRVQIISMVSLDNDTKCYSTDYFNASQCLENEMKQFSYNLSQTDKILTIEEFRQSGGVCSHFAEYLKFRAQQLGFISRTFSFPAQKSIDGNATWHMVAELGNDKGYCLFSNGQIIGCRQFQKDNQTLDLNYTNEIQDNKYYYLKQ